MSDVRRQVWVMMIGSGVCNLSLVILWLAYICIIRKTSLTLLKVISGMMSAYNLAWFFWFCGLYVFDRFPAKIEIVLDYIFWFVCLGNSLFGVSHWMFVMNYFTLALKLHYSKEEFITKLGKLNILYYGFGALNALLPLARQVCIMKEQWFASGIMAIGQVLSWVFTAAVLFWALVVLKKCSGQHSIYLNVKEMSKHALSFFLFATDAILVGCTEISIFFF